MQRRERARIVVIGEDACRKVVAGHLREAGHEVREASSGKEGLRIVAEGFPELTVLRLDLPDMEGLEVCRRIRRGRQGGVPLILISQAFARSERRAEGLHAGGDACLAEPIEAEELLAQVGYLLRVRELDAALRGSEERFRLATEAMDGLVYDWDIAGGVAKRSVGMANFLGWRPEEVPSDSAWWPDQIHPDDVSGVLRHFEEMVKQGAQDCRHEYRIRHKDGHYLWIWDSNRIVHGADGKPARVIGCAVSIDQRKRAEEELHRAKEELALVNEGLERKVAERTVKLADMVAEKESWSYSIAHDMRAPLRSMRGFSHYLLEEYGCRLDDTAADYLRRINAAATRMDAYLKDLLHYGKLGSGEFPLVAVQTSELIREILDTYPNLQPPRCRIEVAEPLPLVRANVSALTQVFANLLDNAVKFVNKGAVAQVRIRAEVSGGRVRLWFEDNGIGIEEGSRGRIFGMFQRLNPASEYEGTGMGLAIVRLAVERMGGQVGVESDPKQGSRFWVDLKRE